MPQAVVRAILHVGLRRGDAEPVTDTVERSLGRPATTLQQYLVDHAALWARTGGATGARTEPSGGRA